MRDTDKYSTIQIDIHNDIIFFTDTRDGSALAINPDCWELIKETVDQQIQDGYLDRSTNFKQNQASH